MFNFGWLRIVPYATVILTFLSVYYYAYSQFNRANEAEQRYTQLQTDIANAHAIAKAEADARLSIATEVIASQARTVQSQEADLAKAGITRTQTKKDLQNALSKLDNFKSANNLLWQRTSDQDSMRETDIANLPSDPQNECTTTTERLRTIERASIYAVNDYDTCRIALDAIYNQLGEPIKHSDE
jgi:hypothetical protein